MDQKIVKYISWALLLIGVLVVVIGAFAGDAGVDLMLYWCYALLGIAILAIIGLGLYLTAKANPNALKTVGIVVGGGVLLVLIAWLLAPGTALENYYGPTPSAGDLKLTDTILNLTYFSGAAAVAAVIFSVVKGARK